MRRLTHVLILVAFVFSCGGQWAVLQGIAWVSMIHDYSQMVPLREAVSMTLSGKYPCALCQAIAEKKQSENGKMVELQKYEKKFFPPLAVAVVQPTPAAFQCPEFSSSFSSRAEVPPVPPPRLA